MKYIIELPEEVKEKFDNATKDDIYGSYYDYNSVIGNAIKNGTPLEEIPNPCIECSQNCCVCELNGEKCECQKVYVVKDSKE